MDNNLLFVLGFLSGSLITSIIGYFLYKSLRQGIDYDLSQSMNSSLTPFKEEIKEYKKSLDLTREKNIENTASLKTELQSMMLLSKKMENETRDLTQALKGDVKSQGEWGELILERTLEISGLTLDKEYVLQGKGMSLRDEDNNLFKPDAIINLPQNLHIIIDSKVSLKSLYQEDYKELKRSLIKHIDGLSSKAYQKLDKLNSPDYVIMFIPLESVMPIIFSDFPDILEYASQKNITIATPISLIPILKTVRSLWRVDSQDKNGIEVAKKAGLLYDKFVVLYEGLRITEDYIQKLSKSHLESMKRLSGGQGDLISKVEELKEMGAKTTKKINLNK